MLMRRGTELRCSVEGVPEPRDESIIERQERCRRHLGRDGQALTAEIFNWRWQKGLNLPRSWIIQSTPSSSQRTRKRDGGLYGVTSFARPKKKEKQEEREQSLCPGGRSFAIDILSACAWLHACMHREDNDRVFWPSPQGGGD